MEGLNNKLVKVEEKIITWGETMAIIPQNITQRHKKIEAMTKKLRDLKEKSKSQVYLL